MQYKKVGLLWKAISDTIGRHGTGCGRPWTNLGRTIGKFWETYHFEQAYELHHEAVQGLSKMLGPDHPKTLTAKESRCPVALVLQTTRKYIFDPLELITEVFETRNVYFGKEQH